MIIWGAILMNVLIIFVLADFIGPERSRLPKNPQLLIALTAIGTSLMAASYFFQQKMMARAVQQQRAESMSSAYIVAFAMCEVAALCGMLVRLLTNERSYYFLFVIAVIGLIVNAPRRADITNAVSAKQI
jgi:F0F1-type ATP synthase membrane subunit c/vacuolar-type H+-ATPase subunit K